MRLHPHAVHSATTNIMYLSIQLVHIDKRYALTPTPTIMTKQRAPNHGMVDNHLLRGLLENGVEHGLFAVELGVLLDHGDVRPGSQGDLSLVKCGAFRLRYHRSYG